MSISELTPVTPLWPDSALPAILVADALLGEPEITHAIQSTRGTRETWLEFLMLTGQLDDVVLARAAGAHAAVPSCPLARLMGVSHEAKAMIPPDLAIEHRVLPVALEPDGDLCVAMVDPTDARAMLEIEFFTGRRLMREVARATAIAWALHAHYGHDTALWRGLDVAA